MCTCDMLGAGITAHVGMVPGGLTGCLVGCFCGYHFPFTLHERTGCPLPVSHSQESHKDGVILPSSLVASPHFSTVACSCITSRGVNILCS